MKCLICALLLSLSVSARAEKDKDDEVKDPFILGEMQKAQTSNLDNALAQSGRNALQSAHYLRALMVLGGAQASSLVSDIQAALGTAKNPASGSAEEEVDDLLLASQMMDAKSKSFSAASQKSGLPLKKSRPEDIAGVGRRYQSKDRTLNRKKAESYLKAALKRLKIKAAPDFSKNQRALLETLDAFQSELSGTRTIASKLKDRLKSEGRDHGGLSEKITFWMKKLEKTNADFLNERAILETQLKLVQSEEEDF
jgi:hypothetical protein